MPDRKQAVVLATDGLPTTCMPKDIGAVAALAAKAAAENPPIKTFVVGVFAPDEEDGARPNLNQLAQAGGTTSAQIVNTNTDVAKSFLAALDDIRRSALSCEYKMPSTPNYGNVNVQFTTGGGQVMVIGYVGEAGKCHATFGGWYYDVNPADGTPTKILTCPRTCDILRSDNKGRFDINIGCKTIYIE
jgi:hypothetical protein